MSGRIIRFDAFEADLTARELSKRGVRLKLQDQPFQVLAALLEKPGEVVTREDLQQRIWGDDTFVDFDKSLSAAVNKVRQALDDSRTRPRFIETVPKVGYRFIGALEADVAELPNEATDGKRVSSWRRWPLPAGLAAAAMLAWSLNPRPELLEPSEPLRAVPLTTYQGYEDDPSFSPDGSQVAFTWDQYDGNGPAVYVKTVGAEPPKRISELGTPADHAAWSPDGGSIAYVTGTGTRQGGSCEIRLISPTGGASRPITSIVCPAGGLFYRSLAWSPNSRLIAFPHKPNPDQPWGLFAVDVATRQTWRLTDPPVGIFADDGPSFSRNGDRLAFVRRLSAFSANEVRTVALDSEGKPALPSTAVELSPLFRGANSVVWARDDSELFLSRSGEVWRAPIEGGGATRALAVGGWLKSLSLNTERGRLAFARQTPDVDIWRLDRESGEMKPLIASTQQDWFHSLSRDGKRIAWTSWQSGFSEIWVCDIDGSNPLQLTNLEVQSGSPTWSPDGKWIAFDTRLEGNADIYVVDSRGGPARPFVAGPDDDLQPAWSPDGRNLYFTSLRGGGFEIWSVTIASPEIDAGEIQLVAPRADGRRISVSPDGRYLYHGGDFDDPEDQWRLYRKRLPDGEDVPVLERAGGFAAANSGVYFLTDPGDRRAISHWSADSGELREVAKLPKGSGNLAVSPDERTIVFTQVESRQADLMLVEGFR